MEAIAEKTVRIGALELRFLVDEHDSPGDLVMFEFIVPTNARVPVPHYHEGVDEVVFGLEGVLTVTRDGETHENSQGRRHSHPPRQRPPPYKPARRRGARARRSPSRVDRPALFRGNRRGGERPGQARSQPGRRHHVPLRAGSGGLAGKHTESYEKCGAIRLDGRLACALKDAGSPSPSHAAPARPPQSAQAAQAGGRNSCR